MQMQQFTDISYAPDRALLERRLVEFAHRLDFGIVTATFVVQRYGHKRRMFTVGNIPMGFHEACHDIEAGKRDPVLNWAKRSSIPFSYDQTLYVTDGAADLWEEQAPFGFRTGITVALHLPAERHMLIGFDREAALPSDPVAMAGLHSNLMLTAAHACEAAHRLDLFPQDRPLLPSERPRLTAREAEMLKHAMDGRSSSTIADTLRISERTVNFHIGNAMVKLGCNSRTQAWLKAQRLGLI
jgi:DNA-binding CsgD family transcriptional regulator